jgi:hypothetical protein
MSDDAPHRRHCPHCKTCFDSEDRDRTTVIARDGTSYSSVEETDPTDGPFVCPPCWAELETARLARDTPDSNTPLADE